VDQILQQVQLLDRSSDFARMYSGGMKRRLSVALSTVGDVQIIVFDGKQMSRPRCIQLLNDPVLFFSLVAAEPTTGLDPLSRRRVWETINSLKKNRVVVLTTHNMEEADFLGDNIMIMHGGRGATPSCMALSVFFLCNRRLIHVDLTPLLYSPRHR
jgi:ABC-type multidrug transport system ATPase subunit